MFIRNPLKYTLLTLAAISLLTWLPGPALRADEIPTLEAQALELQQLYSSMTSLTFNFEQITRTGGRERRGAGSAVFYKTGHQPPANNSTTSAPPASVMRWNYTEPDKQVIINDGTDLLIYTEADRQLIKTPAREIESDITYAFFAGTRNLLDDFAARAADNEYIFAATEELHTMLLVPRIPHNQIREVRIWFDDQGIIHHMVIEDHFDSVTELHFSQIELNTLPADSREEINRITAFTVPPGTEIISR